MPHIPHPASKYTYKIIKNLIEIFWRRIKYQWLDFDAYTNFQNLEENLNSVLDGFGTKYDIKF